MDVVHDLLDKNVYFTLLSNPSQAHRKSKQCTHKPGYV